MNVTVTDLGSCKKQLRIEIEPAEVNAALDEIGREYCKQVALPGFRPGKSPKHLVLKKHEADIRAEARRKLIGDYYKKALEEQKLDVLGQPEIEEIGTDGVRPDLAFTFLANLETEPVFELPDYKGLPIKRPSTVVSEADVNEAVEALRGKHATFEPAAREARPGDVAVVNYTGACDGQPLTELAPAAKGLTEQKAFWVSLEPGSFLPGFSEQLAGAKAGDHLTVNVTFPEDFNPKPLAGKSAVYAVELLEVRERRLPELSEEMAKEWGAESLEKLREGVRRDLENERKYQQRRAVRNQLADALLAKVTCDLPESLLARETKRVAFDLVQENTQRGLSKDLIDKHKEEIYSVAARSAQGRVRFGFLVNRIAEKEGIKVSNDELSQRIVAMAHMYQVPPQKLANDLQKRNGLIEVFDGVQQDKVFALLEAHAQYEDLPPETPTPAPVA